MSLINADNITDYIPQRTPILMVSTLERISEDGKDCETTLQIAKENIFIENGFLNESGLIENMAQSAALKAGYFFKKRNQEVPIGYIGKIGKLKVNSLPNLGKIITTVIKESMQFGSATVVDAQVFQDGEFMAEAQLNIYTQE